MANRLNILHVRASNFVGGPEKQLLEHFRRVDPGRFRLSLCTFEEGDEPSELWSVAAKAGFDVHALRSGSPFDPGRIFQLLGLLKREKIHLLCTHGYKPNILGRIAGWLGGVPTVAISRGWTGESRKIRLYERLDKLFLHYADHVVAVSGGQRDKIVALGVKPENISVIHNCINLLDIPSVGKNSLRSSLGLSADTIIVASAGRLSPEKNQAGMIEAARRVVEENSKTVFIIFGEGVLRPELERKIEASGLKGKFLLPGFHNNLQGLLHEVDIFFLPSFTEGLPNVVLEAFAARKPVVATAVGGIPEVVAHGVSGYLMKPDEIEKMAGYLLQLIDDPGLRVSMGENGYRYVHNEFSFEVQTELYEGLYLRLLNKP